MHIVLFQPEIPANTGNISRTCAVTKTTLHLIEPLGFSIDDKHLKRAGLDYWDKLNLYVYKDWAAFLSANPQANIYLATTKGSLHYTEFSYKPDDYLVFGRETAGLPDEIREAYSEHCIRIPMGKDIRSLNLSNSVAIILYEALRQQGFPNLD
ncbi:MAG: tRNA (uridine(34)/cytosine(34)/5-carboxymethylaminomethyluridine(34)-2'-O)-methyltransferase TrmL [Clostridia bacterium]|nr:tRNA (uridine(34)/cytosine(34)/5-carboxymethylaminomethyluridine(34)-2'-O)-methyltransferase TrmL [Clostridia bacterium]